MPHSAVSAGSDVSPVVAPPPPSSPPPTTITSQEETLGRSEAMDTSGSSQPDVSAETAKVNSRLPPEKKRKNPTMKPKAPENSAFGFINSLGPRLTLGPGVSLPLLSGLAKRSEAAEALVSAALSRFNAGRKIARWAEAILLTKRQQGFVGKKNSDTRSTTTKSPPQLQANMLIKPPSSRLQTHHWILRSMLSPSLRVRRSACRILLDGLSSASRVDTLRNSLLHLADKDIISLSSSFKGNDDDDDIFWGQALPLHCENKGAGDYEDRENSLSHHNQGLMRVKGRRSRDYVERGHAGWNDAEGGDHAIQLYGLLSGLACDASTMITKNSHRRLGNVAASASSLAITQKKNEESPPCLRPQETSVFAQDNSKCRNTGIVQTETERAGKNNRVVPTSPNEEGEDRKPVAVATSNDEGENAVDGENACATKAPVIAETKIDTAAPESEEILPGGNCEDYEGFIEEIQKWSVESFVASGGLRWAARSILRLVVALLQGSGNIHSGRGNMDHSSIRSSLSSDIGGTLSDVGDGLVQSTLKECSAEARMSVRGDISSSSDDVSTEALQTRIVLLVDLCYRLAMYAAVPSSTLSITGVRRPSAMSTDNDSAPDEVRTILGGEKGNEDAPSLPIGNLTSTTSPTFLCRGSQPLSRSKNRDVTNAGQQNHFLISGDNNEGTGAPKPSVVERSRQDRLRRRRRRSTLRRVHDALWSPFSPSAIHVHSNKGGVANQTFGSHSPLSALACLICAHEVLKCQTGKPVPSRAMGMDRCLATLGRLVDPNASVVVTPVPYQKNETSNSGGDAPASALPIAGVARSNNSSASDANTLRGRKRKRSRSSSNPALGMGDESVLEYDRNNEGGPKGNHEGSHENTRSKRRAIEISSISPNPNIEGSVRTSSLGQQLSAPLLPLPPPPLPPASQGFVFGSLGSEVGTINDSTEMPDVDARGKEDVVEEAEEEPDDDDDDDDEDEDEEPDDEVEDPSEDDGEDDEEDDEEEEGVVCEEDAEDVVVAVAEDDDVASEDNADDVVQEDVERAGDRGDDDEEMDEVEGEQVGHRRIVGGQFDDAVLVVDQDDEATNSRRNQNCTDVGTDDGGQPSAAAVSSSASSAHPANALSASERKRSFIKAGMQILEAQHPYVQIHNRHEDKRNDESISLSGSYRNEPIVVPPLLTPHAEQSLLNSLCNIVKPPRKPPNIKIFLRRAPTQEEFFRGSLSRNPISLSSLVTGSKRPATGRPNQSGFGATSQNSSSGADYEPRVRDLRQHIADDLQMSDSAELLELLVANKILDTNLKLRVVSQVLWKKHVLENSTSASSSSSAILSSVIGGQHLISAGSGLSMVFSSGALGDRLSRDGSSGRTGSDGNRSTAIPSLPPVVVTYRLAGVDGEATEDKVEEGDLVDPEAPPDTSSSPDAFERQMEKEFGLTRLVTKGRGIGVLLRSVGSHISDLLRRIRRDDVGRYGSSFARRGALANKNPSREKFLQSPAYPGLVLLRHCARITDNRSKMVQARAPTLLLRMLLDVLNAIDGKSFDGTMRRVEASSNENDQVSIASNPTADALQELIEVLASDISTEAGASTIVVSSNANDDETKSPCEESDGSTLPLLLNSLRSTSLSPPLRKVIAKLLPFLTYGQAVPSRELASNFVQHVEASSLSENSRSSSTRGAILMETFVESAIDLPAATVCDTLRSELIRQGFVQSIKVFVMEGAPPSPPPWSSALYPKQVAPKPKNDKDKDMLQSEWRKYVNRDGLRKALKILIGICSKHPPTQSHIADLHDVTVGAIKNVAESTLVPGTLLTVLHWIECTSDNLSADISMDGLGLLAETLLDALKEGNEVVSNKICAIRKKTRGRKKEIAEERRSKALVGMSAFGPIAGVGMEISNSNLPPNVRSDGSSTNASAASINNAVEESSRTSTSGTVSALASMIGLSNIAAALRSTPRSLIADDSSGPSAETLATSHNDKKESTKTEETKSPPPSWLAEMEAMEDEAGLTCAVCQEGRTLQPSELLGLYAFMKKVSIPYSRCGGRGSIDGTVMLLSLPRTVPDLPPDSDADPEWFQRARSVADAIQTTPHAASTMAAATSNAAAGSSRPSHFVTTVTAGNAIHSVCHAKARNADRNHPKAPKSEWEGASLRNSRVACNVILPLVSSMSSKVPLVAVEGALAEYQTVVSNLLGARPKSMLWTVLHDIRFLLLRICNGEPLNADCGGGSLSSNSSLLFYMMFLADMFAKDAEHDAPETAQHAKELPVGFLAAHEVLNRTDLSSEGTLTLRLRRGQADAAAMSCLCSILFQNGVCSESSDSSVSPKPPSKRLWQTQKDRFLCGLLRYAGRQYACGSLGSGCATARGSNSMRRLRTGSFAEWDLVEMGDKDLAASGTGHSSRSMDTKKRDSKKDTNAKKQSASTINEYGPVLRPILILFAIFDQLSADFKVNMDDGEVEEAAGKLVSIIETCQKAENIQDIIDAVKIVVDQSKMKEEIEKGIECL